MNTVTNAIKGWIMWATLALAPQVANAQSHTNNVIVNTINGRSQNTQTHQYVMICNDTAIPKDTRYAERRRALWSFIDCLYEREIWKWRTAEDILDNAYELELQNPWIRDDVMKHMVAANPVYINTRNMKYYHIINWQAVWKDEYIDVFIKRGAILAQDSKAYRELRGE